MKLSNLGYLIKEGIRNTWANRMMSIASIGVLVSCLVLTGAAVMVSLNVRLVVHKAGESNVTTVFMEDKISSDVLSKAGQMMGKIKNVTNVKYFPKEVAIESYKEVLGDEVFAEMEGSGNPLPDAYKVTMKDLSKYKETVQEIKKIKGVATVSSQSDVADKLTSLNKLVQALSIGVILALVLISMFIISNTIRMTMYSRRFEISIMKSVGATDLFVRIPFLVEGMLIGAVSGVLALFALMFSYDLVIEAMQYIVPFSALDFGKLAMPFMAIFILSGILVGMLGSIISMGKYLKKEGSIILGW